LEPLDDATWRRLRVSALISTKLARRNTVLERAWGPRSPYDARAGLGQRGAARALGEKCGQR
jgi:hypothetical protein